MTKTPQKVLTLHEMWSIIGIRGGEMMSSLLMFRRNQDLTQKEMAKKIGVSDSYYGMIETEVRSPSYNFIKKFMEAFPDRDVVNIFLRKNSTKCVVEESEIS